MKLSSFWNMKFINQSEYQKTLTFEASCDLPILGNFNQPITSYNRYLETLSFPPIAFLLNEPLFVMSHILLKSLHEPTSDTTALFAYSRSCKSTPIRNLRGPSNHPSRPTFSLLHTLEVANQTVIVKSEVFLISLGSSAKSPDLLVLLSKYQINIYSLFPRSFYPYYPLLRTLFFHRIEKPTPLRNLS